ncbi:MAG: hypothetical protein KJ904_08165 [Alphaproteobacteria bacterium]|nr:hypothetical protein [Alphaproteobacteria bacterium]MBU0797204.1 hypothetical protein [Alphaproteobacteria bacterium]MBU0887125.1 hypothetical protein [Alphaproteobacteria bacterium]MBU1814375.1 hypothetical protein [Alphaproteobacteria bacterium]MBU2090299.1 hypothetical protein [Alphaproteobacteria bacterium]
MNRQTLLAAGLFGILALPTAASAATSCSDDAKRLIGQVESDEQMVYDNKTKVVMEMKDGSKQNLDGKTDAAMPRESRDSDRNSKEGVIEFLKGAIEADEDGKADRCRAMLVDARAMVSPPGSDTKAPKKATE